MDRVRYGVLSTSQIARNQHVPAAREAANAEIVAISSRERARAEEWASRLEIPRAYGSYDELLADPGIDAVIVPLPNSLHCEWTVEAAEAGKHVLCEKPLAVTVEEARRMIGAAQANGVQLRRIAVHPVAGRRAGRARDLRTLAGHRPALGGRLSDVFGVGRQCLRRDRPEREPRGCGCPRHLAQSRARGLRAPV